MSIWIIDAINTYNTFHKKMINQIKSKNFARLYCSFLCIWRWSCHDQTAKKTRRPAPTIDQKLTSHWGIGFGYKPDKSTRRNTSEESTILRQWHQLQGTLLHYLQLLCPRHETEPIAGTTVTITHDQTSIAWPQWPNGLFVFWLLFRENYRNITIEILPWPNLMHMRSSMMQMARASQT